MKWFMHQSSAHRDTKLKKVLMKYGAEGYGLYWYCIEHICADVDPKLTFELEHDAEILAHDLKIDTLKVQEIMLYMVKLGLFEISENIIYCMKLARYLGDKNTRNPDLKSVIQKQKVELSRIVPDSPRHVPDSPRLSALEESRGEERREEKNIRRFTPPTITQVTEYCESRGNDVTPSKFIDHYEASGWMRGKNKIKDWKACVRTWERDKDSDSHAGVSYL